MSALLTCERGLSAKAGAGRPEMTVTLTLTDVLVPSVSLRRTGAVLCRLTDGRRQQLTLSTVDEKSTTTFTRPVDFRSTLCDWLEIKRELIAARECATSQSMLFSDPPSPCLLSALYTLSKQPPLHNAARARRAYLRARLVLGLPTACPTPPRFPLYTASPFTFSQFVPSPLRTSFVLVPGAGMDLASGIKPAFSLALGTTMRRDTVTLSCG